MVSLLHKVLVKKEDRKTGLIFDFASAVDLQSFKRMSIPTICLHI